ncbi:MAG TPA: metallophosphoesterase [Trebonia sp.]|nr:metallophosphoesterase [Trebonia sp.]
MNGSYLLVQVSDVHLTTEGIMGPGARPRDNLLRALGAVEAAGLQPDVFLLTGDLADKGEGACYDDLAAILKRAAGTADVVYLPGNHDDRAAFRRHLLGQAGDGPVNQVLWRGGLRIISLDSVIPGQDGGELGEEALRFLRAELAAPAPDGTVVALHHPPVPSPVRPMAAIALRNPAPLRDAIAGTDVRLVVAGHFHHEALGTLGTVPVWVGPAAAYRLDTASTRAFHSVAGTAVSRIELTPGGPLVSTIPCIRDEGPGSLQMIQSAARAACLPGASRRLGHVDAVPRPAARSRRRRLITARHPARTVPRPAVGLHAARRRGTRG